MAPTTPKKDDDDCKKTAAQSAKLLSGEDNEPDSIVYSPQTTPETNRSNCKASSDAPPGAGDGGCGGGGGGGGGGRYGWGVLYKVRQMGRRARQHSRQRLKSGVPPEELVCRIEDSPFRILKDADRGNLEAFIKGYRADPTRLDMQDDKGRRPLHLATAKGHLDIVRFIIDQRADLDAPDGSGDTALHTAIRHNQLDIVLALMQAGADHSLLNTQQMAPLHVACDLGYVEIVKVFAKNPDVDKNISGEFGMKPLHYCSIKDNAECAAILLDYGAAPCTPCDLGYFPIHTAAKSAAANTIEVLIQQGMKCGYDRVALLTFKDKENNMPLHAAVIGGNTKAVEVCLRAGAPVNTQQDDKSTPVHFAAAQGNLGMLQLMYALQTDNFVASLYIADAMLMTPLHRAALFNHKAVVLYLLDKGADINSLDNTECTPLLLAASKGCWDTVQVLVAAGADVRVRDLNARNFLHLAIRFGGKLEQFFLKREGDTTLDDENMNVEEPPTTQPPQQQQQQQDQQDHQDHKDPEEKEAEPPVRKKDGGGGVGGGDKPLGHRRSLDLQNLLDERDECGCTPLHYASKAGHLLALEELIKLGATPSLKNNAKQSPFHFACRYGRYNTCRRLLDLAQGPNIMNETDFDGLTGLHIAAQNGHTKIITLLLQRGAVINRDNDNNTPLHHAAAQGWTRSMRTLLAIHSHLLDVKNIYGETALHVAAKQGKVRAVTLLLSRGAALEKDRDQKTFFDYVIELKLYEVASAVIKHDRWEEVLMTPSSPYGAPFHGLIEHMPVCCEAVLDRCQVISPHDKRSAEYYIEYNFKFLNTPIRCIEAAKQRGDFQPLMTLNAMVQHGRVNCLSHPVSVKFLRLKWCSYGMWFYTLVLGIFVLYLSSLTYFVVGNDSFRHYDDDDVNNKTKAMLSGDQGTYTERVTLSTLSKCCLWIVTVFSVLSMVKEVLQMITQRVRYLADLQNVYEWMLYVSSLLFATPFLLGYSLHWQWEVGAFAVFLAWFNLLIMLQRFDFFGIYVVMFLEILRTLLQVLCVFSVLIVAFGLAFYILLKNEDNHAYATPGLSLLRTGMMMLELDYMGSFNEPNTDGDPTTMHFRGLTLVMIVIFVLFMPILLMNLLIGLAVGDIEAVQRNARLKRLAGQVEMHTDMEHKMPMFLLGRMQHCVFRHYPNKYESKLANFWSRMLVADRDEYSRVMEDKSTSQIEEELLKQKQKIKDMGSTIEKNNQLLRLILQKMEIHTEDDAWDEGFKVDRANPTACIPLIGDSPQSSRTASTVSVGRSLLTKAAIVGYMKKSQDTK